MIKKLFVLLLLVNLLLGCGQMGPLYLPDQKPPITVAKPKSAAKTTTTHVEAKQ